MTDGGYAPIRMVDAGDLVRARDAVTGEEGWKPVTAQLTNSYEHSVLITFESINSCDIQTITSNKIYPFFVQTTRTVDIASEGHVYAGAIENGHWIDAEHLRSGDWLLGADGSWAIVTSVAITPTPLAAFNLSVADTHTYFVAQPKGGTPVWVHNSDRCGGGVGGYKYGNRCQICRSG